MNRFISSLLLFVIVWASGCTNSLLDRSLIFSTHTTAGVEVSITPAETATSPVSMVIGYKRFEGVVNPVFFNHKHTDQNTVTTTNPPTSLDSYYRPEAYSVLAKVGGNITGEAVQAGQVGFSGSQWFSTGLAAIELAKQPGIAAAVAGATKLEVKQDQTVSLSKQPREVAVPTANAIYSSLNAIAPNDIEAKRLLDAINAAASKFVKASEAPKLSYRFTDGDKPVLESSAFTLNTGGGRPPFEQGMNLVGEWARSSEALNMAVKSIKESKTIQLKSGDDAAADITPVQIVQIVNDDTSYQSKGIELQSKLFGLPELAEAQKYLAELIQK